MRILPLALALAMAGTTLADDAEKALRARQAALHKLATQPGPEADRELSRQLDELDAGRLPLALWLDVLEAAGRRDDPALRARLAERARVLATAPDPLRSWRECLEGGSVVLGRTIFREKPEAGCLRCHSVDGEGGAIGPDLSKLSQRAQRISILESILDPNAYIVMGFKNLLVKLKDGREIAGIVNAESEDKMRLISVVDGKPTTIRTDEIETETALPSAMPPGFGQILGKRAIRDLVEFLATRD